MFLLAPVPQACYPSLPSLLPLPLLATPVAGVHPCFCVLPMSSLFALQEPCINKPAVSVQARFSLQRTYVIFRPLELCHLAIFDLQNRVVGAITRKDAIPTGGEPQAPAHTTEPDAGEQSLDLKP